VWSASRRVDDGKRPLIPKQLERRKRRMQPEEAIELDHLLSRNVNAGSHRIVGALGMGHNDVQAIRCAALEDDHQPLVVGAGFRCSPCGPRKEGRYRCGTDHRHCAALQECPSRDGHGLLISLWLKLWRLEHGPAMTLMLAGCPGFWDWAAACGTTMRSSIVSCVCFEMSPAISSC
jgi:hypothetical protein